MHECPPGRIAKKRRRWSGDPGCAMLIDSLIGPDTVTDQPRPASTEELRSRIAQALPELGERYPIRSIGIFGSWARGEQTDESDVDLLVALREPIGYFELLDLEEELARRLGTRVDLTTPGALKPRLRESIERDLLSA
jgi:uncharacterized protein